MTDYNKDEISRFLGVEATHPFPDEVVFDLRQEGWLLTIKLCLASELVSVKIVRENDGSRTFFITMTCRRVMVRVDDDDDLEEFLSFDAERGSTTQLEGSGHITMGTTPSLWVSSVLQSSDKRCVLLHEWSVPSPA